MLRRQSKDQPVAGADAAPAPHRQVVSVPAGPVTTVVDVPVAAAEVRAWLLDADRWPRFMGRHAWIDPVLGGRLRVEMAPGVFTAGQFVEIGEAHLVFTWGRESDPSMPVGSTNVTVDLQTTGPSSTRISLVHEGLADRSLAEEHEGGWRYHLVRLGVAATGVGLEAEAVDLFLAATHEPNPIARRGLLERTCADEIEVADGHDDTYGVTALVSKLGRLVAEAPGVRLHRVGEVQRVGALLRCDYALSDAEGEIERGELVASVDRRRHLLAVSLFG